MYIVSKWLHKIKSHQIGDSKTILMNFHENENISFTALLKNLPAKQKKGLMQCLLLGVSHDYDLRKHTRYK